VAASKACRRSDIQYLRPACHEILQLGYIERFQGLETEGGSALLVPSLHTFEIGREVVVFGVLHPHELLRRDLEQRIRFSLETDRGRLPLGDMPPADRSRSMCGEYENAVAEGKQFMDYALVDQPRHLLSFPRHKIRAPEVPCKESIAREDAVGRSSDPVLVEAIEMLSLVWPGVAMQTIQIPSLNVAVARNPRRGILRTPYDRGPVRRARRGTMT